MDLDVLGELNWLGVIVAAIVYFVIGGLWYSPVLFAKPWMASIGWEPDPDYTPGLGYMLAPAVTCLIECIAIGALAEATGSNTFDEGLVLGVVVAVIVGSLFAVTAFFEPSKPAPRKWGLITGSYHVLGALVAGVLIAVL